ncbi:hypothetical protein F2Q69_00040714 [Brassica cretica]|uniref:Translation elongation factor EFG/EF2 domain-containing protein n=1 Tax=Brassica cretica TaxID=69181 RepID=A0A8S9NDU7_BRACR|nr:hypothetical protein F2Q69_00040714 [Brassica cretica]
MEYCLWTKIDDAFIVYSVTKANLFTDQILFKESKKDNKATRFEPLEAGSGYEFKSEIKGGAVPRDYNPGVMKELEECISSGVVVHVRACLVDGLTMMFEPLEAGSGYEFKSEIKGGAVPRDYNPGVMKELEECISSGVVVHVRACLVDGLTMMSTLLFIPDTKRSCISNTMQLAKFDAVPQHTRMEPA